MAQERQSGENPRGDAGAGIGALASGSGPGHPLGQERLADIAREINFEHRERGGRERVARKHRACAFAHAIRAGELLLEAQGLVSERRWSDWLRENFEGSQRTAYNYMNVAKNQDDPNLQPVANESGLKGALSYLSDKRGKPRAAKQVAPAEPLQEGASATPMPASPGDEIEEERAGGVAGEDTGRKHTPDVRLAPAPSWGDEDEPEDEVVGDGPADGADGGEAREAREAQEIRRAWKRRWGSLPPRRGGVGAPVLRGPGSKDRIGRYITEMLPEEHKLYVEPYLGTGAVLLNKEPSDEEVVNDVNKEISNFFDVLREQPDDLARAVDLSPFSEADLMKAYRERGLPGLDPVERARRWVVCAHQGFLRQPGPPSFTMSSAATSRDSVRLWNELPEHIREAGLRMKLVRVSCRDATELIWDELYRRPEAALYVDPPYLPETRAPGQYLYEMSEPKHIGMLDALLGHPGAVFLSGYDADLYHEALAGWATMDMPGHSSTGFRKEVLWMNEAAHAGALAAEAKRKEEARKAQATPTGGSPGLGMVYQRPGPRETEAPAYAAALGALLEGWRFDRGAAGGEDGTEG